SGVPALPHAPGREDMRALLDAPPVDTALGRRDRAMLELLYGAGLRVSELVRLRPTNVDLDANCVRLVGKGGRERVVPLGRIARQRLSEYQADARPTLVAGARARPELFVSRRGTPAARHPAHARAPARPHTSRARLNASSAPRRASAATS